MLTLKQQKLKSDTVSTRMGLNNTTTIHSQESINLFNENLLNFNEKSVVKETTSDGDETD